MKFSKIVIQIFFIGLIMHLMNVEGKSIYDFTLKDIRGNTVSLSSFKGKKMVIVNVASYCGYTSQYKDLQKLHEKYGDKVAILAFPANNFGSQEPGSNAEIAQFCKKEYNVSFTVFEKLSVKGADKHPLYQWLSTKSENGLVDQEPTWNFCKYILDENGKMVGFYRSGVNPMSAEFLKELGL